MLGRHEGEARTDVDAEAGLGVAPVMAHSDFCRRCHCRRFVDGQRDRCIETEPYPGHTLIGGGKIAALVPETPSLVV